MATSPVTARRSQLFVASLCSIALLGTMTAASQIARETDVLQSTDGLPAHVVGLFRQPVAFQQSINGDYYVLDRRGQTVYRVTPTGEAEELVEIGPEQGRLLGATSLHVGPSGRFVVADAPSGRERVQIFEGDGTPVGQFTLPGRAAPRITLGTMVLNGVGSLQFTDRSILMNQPELGGLITEFSLAGHPFRTFGTFRRTGHEDDRDVNLSLNSGIPLVDPTGGYYFVFQAGVPIFRKYDAAGTLRFERHIEGAELDPIIAALMGFRRTWCGLPASRRFSNDQRTTTSSGPRRANTMQPVLFRHSSGTSTVSGTRRWPIIAADLPTDLATGHRKYDAAGPAHRRSGTRSDRQRPATGHRRPGSGHSSDSQNRRRRPARKPVGRSHRAGGLRV